MKKPRASICLILLCWFVYASSYLGKVNYAANVNQVMGFFNVDHGSAGLVSTFFFFAYGIGQVINGLFCKKYNIKWMVFISLIVSGSVNLAVAILNNFSIIKYLWLFNGISMSFLWPNLIRLLSETVSKKDIPKATAVMGTTVATGTVLVYATSALFAKINFKLSFYVPAVLFMVVALVWIFSVSNLVEKVKSEVEESTENAITESKKEPFNKTVLLLTIGVLAFFGVATNLIKDGLTTWVPSILKEQYHLDATISIVLTLALPIVAIFANAFAVKVHKKIKDFVLQCALMFLISGCVIGCVIAGISLNQFIITLIGFTVVCFLVSSCNAIITSVFPLFMKGKINSGLIAGLLNGFCYLGSTISSYGLGLVADKFGWTVVFFVLFAVCVVVCAVAVVYLLFKNRETKKLFQG